MQSINWTLTVLSIKEEHVLNGLLLPTHDIDDILSQLPAEKSTYRRYLTANILQEAPEKIRSEGLGWQLELFVLFGSQGSKEFDLSMGVRRVQSLGQTLILP